MVLAHWERRRGGFGGCCPLSHLSALRSTAGRVLPRHSDSKNTFLPALVSPKPLQIQSWLGARYLPCLFHLPCFLMKARAQPLPSTHTCLIGFKNPLFSQQQLCPSSHCPCPWASKGLSFPSRDRCLLCRWEWEQAA